jgi:hypothetical protein
LPGDKDPTQAISTCPYCNSCVNQDIQICQNCGKTILPQQGNPHPRKVPNKGERYEEYGPKEKYITPLSPITSSLKTSKKEKDDAEKDKNIVKDKYISDEFNMCLDPYSKNVDDKEDILKSCLDLAIDG